MTGEAFVFCEFLRWAMSEGVPSDRTGVICNYYFAQLLAKQFSWAFQSDVNPIEIDASKMQTFPLTQAVFNDRKPDTLILYVRCHGKKDGNGGWEGLGPYGEELSMDSYLAIVERIKPKSLILFIDSCYSAAAIEAVKKANKFDRNYIILASSDTETGGEGVYFDSEKVLPKELVLVRRKRGADPELKVGGGYCRVSCGISVRQGVEPHGRMLQQWCKNGRMLQQWCKRTSAVKEQS